MEAAMRARKSALILGLLVAQAATAADVQTWPTHPLTMVYPFAPGSAGDGIGRVLAPVLSDILGQPVIFENVGGAGGMTGAGRVAKAEPDGYQFLLGGTYMVLNQTIYRKPAYNAVTDFEPVVLMAEQPTVLIARKDLPANDIKELIAYAKANQGKMQFGSAGVGSITHFSCVLLNAAMEAHVTHVPYRGGGGALQDLIAGRIDYQCPIINVALPHIASGTVKAIAVLSKERSFALPELASAHEQGLENFDVTNWYGFFLPKGASAPTVQKLHDATVSALGMPLVQERLKAIGTTIVSRDRQSSGHLRGFVGSEIEKWAGPIKASGAQID
jgi:tripartite-type tricarboxylate transporter receptor subunit TctC